MGVKLYVEFLNEDKSMGVLRNQKIIHYNLWKLERDKKPSHTFTAGRYVVTMLADANYPLTMLFIDFVANPDEAKRLINSQDMPQSLKNQMQSLLEAYNSTYHTTKNNVELIKGNPPGLVL